MHSVSSQNPIILIFGESYFTTGVYLQLLPNKPRAHDLYYSPIIIWLIKTIIMTCVGHVARTEDRRVAHRDLGQKPERERERERGHLEELAVDGGIMLKWFFRKCDLGMDWIYLSQDRDR
jgi:hypothetical protein